jgi:hypothetical protein
MEVANQNWKCACEAFPFSRPTFHTSHGPIEKPHVTYIPGGTMSGHVVVEPGSFAAGLDGPTQRAVPQDMATNTASPHVTGGPSHASSGSTVILLAGNPYLSLTNRVVDYSRLIPCRLLMSVVIARLAPANIVSQRALGVNWPRQTTPGSWESAYPAVGFGLPPFRLARCRRSTPNWVC